jgi:D-alanine-D-alanine ligase
VTGCFDVGRVDFRLDAHNDNKPYILEINPLPGLNPGYSDLPLEAQADGWTFEALINRILAEASDRYGLEADTPFVSLPG